MPAYIQGNLAVEQRTENKVKTKETKRVVYRKQSLPLQEKLLYLFTVAICVVVAGVIIWRYAQIYEMNNTINKIEKDIAKLESENSILKQKVEMFSDPQHLLELAKQYGYTVPEEQQVKVAGAPKASGNAKNGAATADASKSASGKKSKDQP